MSPARPGLAGWRRAAGRPKSVFIVVSFAAVLQLSRPFLFVEHKISHGHRHPHGNRGSSSLASFARRPGQRRLRPQRGCAVARTCARPPRRSPAFFLPGWSLPCHDVGLCQRARGHRVTDDGAPPRLHSSSMPVDATWASSNPAFRSGAATPRPIEEGSPEAQQPRRRARRAQCIVAEKPGRCSTDFFCRTAAGSRRHLAIELLQQVERGQNACLPFIVTFLHRSRQRLAFRPSCSSVMSSRSATETGATVNPRLASASTRPCRSVLQGFAQRADARVVARAKRHRTLPAAARGASVHIRMSSRRRSRTSAGAVPLVASGCGGFAVLGIDFSLRSYCSSVSSCTVFTSVPIPESHFGPVAGLHEDRRLAREAHAAHRAAGNQVARVQRQPLQM